MGNAAYGSSLADLREGMGRIDDMNDVSLINAYKQNADNAYSNWFQANASLVSDYNDQVTSLEDEYSKLYSQYWSTLSNIDPTMALQKNMELAAKRGRAGEKGKVKDGDYYIEPFDLEPDEELRKLMYQKEHASPVNPMTKSYVRPDQGQTRLGRTNGTYSGGRLQNNNSRQGTAANPAFYDNITAYQRPRPEGYYRAPRVYNT